MTELELSKPLSIMKTNRILYWISTGLIFLSQGLIPIFTTKNPETIEGFTHLGYPSYFIMMLAIFKLFGGLALIVPLIPAKIKEWAYAGFLFDFIAAAISITAVDGFGASSLFPIIAILILIISYCSFHKINGTRIL